MRGSVSTTSSPYSHTTHPRPVLEQKSVGTGLHSRTRVRSQPQRDLAIVSPYLGAWADGEYGPERAEGRTRSRHSENEGQSRF